jgi:hypothetical protein
MPATDATQTDSSPEADAPETDVPGDAPRCSYCGGAFPTERLRDLHRGLEHYDDIDETERDAYEAAYVSEGEDLRSFRLRALAVLVVLYFGFLLTYAVVAT